ncbi:HNH endonuclease [Nocardia tengchongensis]|uniref:HNH endonuclease n=1 Tax=Nocardia tengchongensis TaxID=2055889 RepID=UPI0036AEA547
MTISMADRKLLWGLSGSRCAFPECRVGLAHTSDLTGSSVILGEEAHIVARNEDGPRGREPIHGDRDAFENLVLMCPTHHRLIDSAVADYPVDEVHRMKAQHQAWVRDSLEVDSTQLDLDVRWASIVDQFDKRISLLQWDRIAGALVYDVDPILTDSVLRELRELCRWIQVRAWPSGHELLRTSLEGFARVTSQLLSHFMKEAESVPTRQGFRYPRWYKIQGWNPELYDRLLREYKQARRLMEDLVYEATRHLNWFMDSVRQTVDPGYREVEGFAYLRDESEEGEFARVPRFSESELADGAPYISLTKFLEDRDSRIPRARQ